MRTIDIRQDLDTEVQYQFDDSSDTVFIREPCRVITLRTGGRNITLCDANSVDDLIKVLTLLGNELKT